jgi:hypothetical protein
MNIQISETSQQGVPHLYSSSNIRVIKSKRMRWAGHVERTGAGEVHTGFWWENLIGKRPLGRPKCWRILKWYFKKQDRSSCTVLIWLRIWSSGGLLWTRQWTFELHNMRGIPWAAEEMLDSQVGYCSVELGVYENYKKDCPCCDILYSYEY